MNENKVLSIKTAIIDACSVVSAWWGGKLIWS